MVTSGETHRSGPPVPEPEWRKLNRKLAREDGQVTHALDSVDRVPANYPEWLELHRDDVKPAAGSGGLWASRSGPRPVLRALRDHLQEAHAGCSPAARQYSGEGERVWHVKRVIDALTYAQSQPNQEARQALLDTAVVYQQALSATLAAVEAAITEAAEAYGLEVGFLPETPR
jgi:predicted RNase H-like nuclease